MDIRIISGSLRGRKLRWTELAGTHPMGAREKLALFNMVAAVRPLAGAMVLDAYAGSGALGMEALSLGAERVTLVEKNAVAARMIKENLAALGVSERAEVCVQPVGKWAALNEAQYDVVVADPPYDDFDDGEAALLAARVKPGGVMVLSHPSDVGLDMPGMTLEKTRTYAAAHLSLYTR